MLICGKVGHGYYTNDKKENGNIDGCAVCVLNFTVLRFCETFTGKNFILKTSIVNQRLEQDR